MTAHGTPAKRGAVKTRAAAYHHGALKPALVRAAIALLRSKGPAALSLRAVARAAGVSEAAPYRHFSSRSALVVAVAEDAFRRLRLCMLEAAAGPASGGSERAALQQLGLAYVTFGVEHPAEYRVMFGTELAAMPRATLPPSYIAESRGTLALLERGIAALQQRGLVREGSVSAMATCAWASMHGLVMLSLDGQIGAESGTLVSLAHEATLLLIHGMAMPRPPAPDRAPSSDRP